MTFTQNKKSTNTVSMEKNTNYPFIFFEKKTRKKRSLGSKIENKQQPAFPGTKHTVTTDKKKIIHRKLISDTLHRSPPQSESLPGWRQPWKDHPAQRPENKPPAANVEKNHRNKTRRRAQTC